MHWARTQLVPAGGVTVACVNGTVVGVLATHVTGDAGWIDQLYIDPEFCHQGIGTELLERGLDELPRPVRLYTFQQNHRSRAFYEHHGFRPVIFGDGQQNEEQCPDVLYQLANPGLPIATPSLLLRRFTPDDAPAILALNAEPSTRRWLPTHVYEGLEDAQSAMEFLIASYTEPGNPREGPWVLAVEHRATTQLIGHVGFSPFDDMVEISFAVAESARGQGYGAESIVPSCHWIADAFQVPTILAITAADNRASRKTLEQARFVHERDVTMDFQGRDTRVARYLWRRDER